MVSAFSAQPPLHLPSKGHEDPVNIDANDFFTVKYSAYMLWVGLNL